MPLFSLPVLAEISCAMSAAALGIIAVVFLAVIGIGCIVVAGRAADDDPYDGEGWS